MFYQSVLISLLYSSSVSAIPKKRWPKGSYAGVNYFQTNGFEGNQLVSSYILKDGTLSAGQAVWTGGNGSAGINDPAPYENHPDPFYGTGSVVVSGDSVFVVNAGSNSFSVFDIDTSDGGYMTLDNVYSSNGEFPTSLTASPDGQVVCVSNSGAKNGFSCHGAGANGWTHMQEWDRSYNLNLTTPPHGPAAGTPSQILFAQDYSALLVAVVGEVPTALNNLSGQLQKGEIWVYPISDNQTLASEPTKVPAGLPFSIVENLQAPGSYFLSDVLTGYATWRSNTTSVIQGTVPNQSAVCWAAQSPRTGSFYVVDIGGKSNITEISVDPTTLNGTIVSQHSLGTNASGTDNSIFYGADYDYMYVNAPAYKSIHTYKIWGSGSFELVQRFNLWDMPQALVPTKGFVGQANWYAPK